MADKDSRLVDPHVHIYVRAMSQGDPDMVPALVPTEQELRASHDLGLYTVEQLEDLLKEMCELVGEWVGNHPPHEDEDPEEQPGE